jgi:RHS repeat-associated protein
MKENPQGAASFRMALQAWACGATCRLVSVLLAMTLSAVPALALTPTTTTLTSNLNPATAGSTVSFTATVTGSAPTGSVSFKEGSTVLKTSSLNSSGVATFNTSNLAAGTHNIFAVYPGNSTNAASTSTFVVQTIRVATTTSRPTASPASPTFGQSVTLSANVTSSAGVTGSLTFFDSGVSLGTVSTNTGGTFTMSISSLAVGAHSISASYSGDQAGAPSSGTSLTLTVTKAPSVTALTAAPNPSYVGDTYTVSASVTGAGTPTGIVTFKRSDLGTTVGSATLVNGVASIVVTPTNNGTQSYTGKYGGDANNNASVDSPVYDELVNKAVTSATVSSDVNPAGVGQNITLTATVTGQNPSGSVTFKDSGTALGSDVGLPNHVTQNTKTVTFVVSALAAGSHDITATYKGDGTNSSVTSPVYVQAVKAGTSLTLSASPSSVTAGQTVTFTATVNGSSPSGTVTFVDTFAGGTTTLAATPLTSGTALFSSNALAAGSHSVSASYAGDAANAPASSPTPAVVAVNLAPTTAALTSTPNPSTFGQAVTFTASVSGGISPGGAVTFKDGTTVVGTATLAIGAATFTSSTLVGGTHTFTVSYGGDSLNAASVSPAVIQSVSGQPTNTALVASPSPSQIGQNVTLTATINAPGATGVVTFKNGAATLGTAAATGGMASLVSNQFALGSGNNLTAVYAGDAYYLGSTSPAIGQTVNPSAAPLTLTASPNPATLGENVTLNATIAGYNVTGSVTFSDSGTPLGTATVTGGNATLSTSTLLVGAHSITALYSGDTNNLASNGSANAIVNARSGFTWQYGYDAMGRMNTVVDPNAQASYTYYDSLGRAFQTQQPPGQGASTPTVIQLGYDLGDTLTSVIDPRALTTTYTVTGLGTTKNVASPDTGSTQYSYDAKGNLTQSNDARGKVTNFGYDSLDRLRTVTFAADSPITFEYDGGTGGPANEAGELTKITDESGQTTYTHDALGRLIAKSVTIGAKTFNVAYTWGDSGTALDKLTAITYPSGSKVNYAYDSHGFVSAITVNPVNANGVGQSGTAQTLLSAITYNADNNPTGWQWSDGKARSIGYDSAGQVASYTLGDAQGTGNAAGALRTLVRDSAERIKGYTHSNNQSTLDQSFDYDNLNRLTTASVAGVSNLYSYDETGNRTSKTIGAATYTNTVDAASNKLTQIQDVGGTSSVLYDLAGHITSDGANTYTYNDRGRMTGATTPGGAVAFLYNGLNQRASKSGSAVAGGSAYFIYDEAGQLLGEYDNTGAPVYETVYLGSTPVGVMKQTGAAANNNIAVTLYDVDADQIDTPRMITKQDHTIAWRWDTAEAFGGTAPNQDPSGLGTFVFNQRFPGQVADIETGLFQNWNREYNARLGRYVESDPIGLDGGINTYLYVGGNAVAYSDLRGLDNPVLGRTGSTESTECECSGAAEDPPMSARVDLMGNPTDPNYPGVGAAQLVAGTTYIGATAALLGTEAASSAAAGAVAKFAKKLNFDGPNKGLAYGNGRVCQIRYKQRPVFRLDYQPLPGSNNQPRLHFHVAPFMDTHIVVDPRALFDK